MVVLCVLMLTFHSTLVFLFSLLRVTYAFRHRPLLACCMGICPQCLAGLLTSPRSLDCLHLPLYKSLYLSAIDRCEVALEYARREQSFDRRSANRILECQVLWQSYVFVLVASLALYDICQQSYFAIVND